MGSPTKHLTRQISEALELNKKWQMSIPRIKFTIYYWLWAQNYPLH
jgi:hypothetical protein